MLSFLDVVQHLRCGDFIVKEPMVIGHECAGVIEEVGKAVKDLAVGDRVALEPGIACNKCNLCKEGFYNLCPEMEFFATPPVHGSLANHVCTLLITHSALIELCPFLKLFLMIRIGDEKDRGHNVTDMYLFLK